MKRWASTPYRKRGKEKGIDVEVIERSLTQAHSLQDNDFPAVLTLGHLAKRTEVKYGFLRKVIGRKIEPYRTFRISKRSGGYRNICVPCPDLMKVHKWIDQFILSKLNASPYSYAFNKGQSIVDCAKQHLGCRWIIKIDVRHFFESLSEIQAYHVFLDCGYDKLIAFEMARLCTKVTRLDSKKYDNENWLSKNSSPIDYYDDPRIGYLPQGVPTSPKLSNKIVYELDYEIEEKAKKYDLAFTRYADDITLSTTSEGFNREKAVDVIQDVYSLFPKYGLRPNPQKAQIIPPGARKLVLGLLVDSDRVRLPKSFRRKIECHLYYCSKDPEGHAKRRDFNSVIGLKNYIKGLMAYVEQVEPEYKKELFDEYGEPDWPL